jgi:RNA polymerase sigma-70 factor (ECF subfamily)
VEFYPAIRNYLYYKTSDVGMAEDIAQDTFIKLWENRAKIDKRTVKSFLYTISGNLAINQLKRQQLQYKFENQAIRRVNRESPEFNLQMKEYEEKLNQVISSMPEGSREVFLMNRLEDLKYREIAERLGISVKAVEKRMSKALQIIREKLNVKL